MFQRKIQLWLKLIKQKVRTVKAALKSLSEFQGNTFHFDQKL